MNGGSAVGHIGIKASGTFLFLSCLCCGAVPSLFVLLCSDTRGPRGLLPFCYPIKRHAVKCETEAILGGKDHESKMPGMWIHSLSPDWSRHYAEHHCFAYRSIHSRMLKTLGAST
jgi:hypothetical protein